MNTSLEAFQAVAMSHIFGLNVSTIATGELDATVCLTATIGQLINHVLVVPGNLKDADVQLAEHNCATGMQLARDDRAK